MPIRFIHAMVCTSSFVYLFCLIVFHCMTISQFIYSPFDRNLGYFYFRIILNQTAIDIQPHVFSGHFLYLISVGNISKSRVAESYGKCTVTYSRNFQFSKVFIPVYTFNSDIGELQLIHILPVFSHFSYSGE